VLEKIQYPLEGDPKGSFYNLWFSLAKNLLIRLLKTGAALAVVYYVLEYYNYGQNLFEEKFKFELKTATDIKTRLSDVKGVDEIKEEVEDLIKMLKDPDTYR
jgi:ATP-dependent Zn protease